MGSRDCVTLQTTDLKLRIALTNWFGISSATVTPATCVFAKVGTQGIAPLADYHTIKGRRFTVSRVETLP
ncbi:hypothetical protein GCM10023156_26210 [Novipirellula rosea]|uniref:Uncharacterized protein n=1 Tax=Novipirellula rosea TaxID=1031540 RepID=A0ABP8MTK3_9BACT